MFIKQLLVLRTVAEDGDVCIINHYSCKESVPFFTQNNFEQRSSLSFFLIFFFVLNWRFIPYEDFPVVRSGMRIECCTAKALLYTSLWASFDSSFDH